MQLTVYYKYNFLSLQATKNLTVLPSNNTMEYIGQKLSWRERIGFCTGDLAQNIIYQTVSIWLLFYYTNVYGLAPALIRFFRICTMN